MRLPTFGPGWASLRAPLSGLVLVLLTNLVVYTVWTRPHWLAVARETSALRLSAELEQVLLPALERARLSYGRIIAAEADLAGLRNRVFESSGSVTDTRTLVLGAVRASGLSPGRTSYQTAEVEELGLLQLRADLPVRGSYAGLRRLVHTLESSPSFVSIDRVAVAVPPDDDGAGLQVQLSVSGFAAEGPVDPDGASETAEGSWVAETPESNTGSGLLSQLSKVRSLRRRLDGLAPVPVDPGALQVAVERLDGRQVVSSRTARNLFDFGGRTMVSGDDSVPEFLEGLDAPNLPPTFELPIDLIGIINIAGTFFASLDDGDDVHVVTVGDLLPNGIRVLRVGRTRAVLDIGNQEVTLGLGKRRQATEARGRQREQRER